MLARSLLALICCATPGPWTGWTLAAAGPEAGRPTLEETTPSWLDLIVNEVPKGQVLGRFGGGDVFLSEDDLRGAGLAVTGGERVVLGDRSMLSLRSLAPAVTFALDEEGTSLRITASHTVLGRERLDLHGRKRPATLSRRDVPSAFLNLGGRVDDWERSAAAAELGIGAGPALLLANASWSTAYGFVRGATVATWDDADRLIRYAAGEFLASPGDPLGGSSLLLGTSAGREFSLDPYVIRDPYPRTTLFVPTPSTLEVWVGDTLVRRQPVAPGTLDIENLPVVAGVNQVRTVIRDAFGREQSASTNFLMGTNLLGVGLTDWQVAVGARGRSGAAGAVTYQEPLLVGRYRRGLSRRFTLGGRAEIGTEVANGGGSAGLATDFGDLELGVATSVAGRPGAAAFVGWRARPLVRGSVVAQIRWLSERYANASLRPGDDRALLRGIVGGAFSPVPGFALSADLTASRLRDAGDGLRGTLRASWSLGAGKQLALSGSLGRTTGADESWELFASYSMLLGGAQTAEISARGASDGEAAWFSATRPVGSGPGVGYRILGRAGDGALGAVDLTGQNEYGRLAVMETWIEPLTGDQSHHEALEASTGLVLMDGDLHVTRPVEGSFSLVVLEDAPGVRVTLDGQPVGRTDGRGRLFVPGLLPYFGNRLAIRDADLPLDFRVNEVERYVAPRYRGGTVEHFDVGPARVVVGRVVLAIDERGEARDVAPEWGEIAVELPTGRVVSPIGAGGDFWLEGLTPGRQEALVRWEGRLCRFTLEVGTKPGIVDAGLQRCVQMLAIGGGGASGDRP